MQALQEQKPVAKKSELIEKTLSILFMFIDCIDFRLLLF